MPDPPLDAPPPLPTSPRSPPLLGAALLAGVLLGLVAAALLSRLAGPERHLAVGFWRYVGLGFGGGVGLAVTVGVLNRAVGFVDYVKSRQALAGESDAR